MAEQMPGPIIKMTLLERLKCLVFGKACDVEDKTVFHRLSLIALLAWVGLGADGLSSSCYGPQEAFLALGSHTFLSIFVALGTVITIFIVSASYSQIIELFPTGGGGYLVASKLLSPKIGMVSGCALLIDYVLTITVSVASGADAVFSLLPMQWYPFRLGFAILIVFILIWLNMRGVKESVLPLVPIFLMFLLTHVFIILYVIFKHLSNAPELVASTTADIHGSLSSLGFWGMIFLVVRAYSMGAGTFTGIEAVSNSIPVLREPKVQTAKKTMMYMAASLSFVVLGLMVAYLLFSVTLTPGKTLNAVLFEYATAGWGKSTGFGFILLALFSEATLLFVAAQAGFIDGPRVMAYMALDRWFPTRFSTLSDRLVIQNGILIMGGLALGLMVLTGGSVRLLVVLYSINVFITFCLSQSGMVRHWWQNRRVEKKWKKKLLINGVGLLLCLSILIFMIIFKFFEGGWITLFITAALVAIALGVRRHYNGTMQLLNRLDSLVKAVEAEIPSAGPKIEAPDPKGKTAVIMDNGFNGIGLHTVFGVIQLFGTTFKNFVFVQVGTVDAGNFKGTSEMENLQAKVRQDLDRYVDFMKKRGYYSEGVMAVGVDVPDEIAQLAPGILKKFRNAVFFGGQLVFHDESFLSRLFHNHTVFGLQARLYHQGIPFVILPIRV